MSQELQIGTLAPDFTLPSHLDSDVTLSQLRGTKVLIAFYVFDFSPG